MRARTGAGAVEKDEGGAVRGGFLRRVALANEAQPGALHARGGQDWAHGRRPERHRRGWVGVCRLAISGEPSFYNESARPELEKGEEECGVWGSGGTTPRCKMDARRGPRGWGGRAGRRRRGLAWRRAADNCGTLSSLLAHLHQVVISSSRDALGLLYSVFCT